MTEQLPKWWASLLLETRDTCADYETEEITPQESIEAHAALEAKLARRLRRIQAVLDGRRRQVQDLRQGCNDLARIPLTEYRPTP